MKCTATCDECNICMVNYVIIYYVDINIYTNKKKYITKNDYINTLSDLFPNVTDGTI